MVKLSIVIPYYETYELTVKLLETLIPQLTEETEVFLIDDGCNEKRLDKYSDKINIVHLEKNVGGAGASNVGIDKAKGKYIGFVDSDDMVDKKYISTLIDAIDNHNEDVIYMDWQDIANGNIIHRPDNYASWKAIYKRTIVPRYNENVYFSYDVPFYSKLKSKPFTKYYIDKVLYYYYSNREGNLTSLKGKEIIENMITCEVIEPFTLERFDELKEIKRKSIDVKGKLFIGDTFKCEKDMAEYLTGKNAKNKTVVKILEVVPKVVKKSKK